MLVAQSYSAQTYSAQTYSARTYDVKMADLVRMADLYLVILLVRTTADIKTTANHVKMAIFHLFEHKRADRTVSGKDDDRSDNGNDRNDGKARIMSSLSRLMSDVVAISQVYQ